MDRQAKTVAGSARRIVSIAAGMSGVLALIAILGLVVPHALAQSTPKGATTGAPPTRPPNIVFILADDLGYGDVGAFGQKRIHTPNIDRLATEGVKFTQFYAGCTVCTPSRCTLMTGLHNGHAPERGNGDEDTPITMTILPQMMKSAGYATAAIGKWGIGEPDGPNLPTSKGFDSFFGYLDNTHAHNYYPSYLYRDDKKVQLTNIVPNETPRGAGVSTNKAEYSNDLFAAEALKYIDTQKAADHPFFLYLPFTIPHANDEARLHGTEVPDVGEYAAENWPDVEKGFAGMVTRLDSYVGRILERLKANGLEDNTIIVFTSDNGPHKEGGHDPAYFQSWGPLRGIKRDMTEGGIREPTIIRWPGHTHAGTTSDYIGGFVDVMPTFAQIAGVPAPANIDGISFVNAIEGKDAAQAAHTYMYWEFYEGKTSQAVRAGNWKAIRIPMLAGPIQLFDLTADLHEDHDVAADHPDIVEKVKAMMDQAHTPHQIQTRRGV